MGWNDRIDETTEEELEQDARELAQYKYEELDTVQVDNIDRINIEINSAIKMIENTLYKNYNDIYHREAILDSAIRFALVALKQIRRRI